MYGSKQGFSLIELLITLIIIGVLLSIALPSYNYSVMSAHRFDGKIGLLQLAAQLEKGSSQLSTVSPEGFYQLKIISHKSDDFLLAAIPIKSQSNDKICGTLALNSKGQSGILRSNQLIVDKTCG